ncbi:MAG TPA: ATP-binding protein [Syntrophales bacterium]|nr:ATP-binding protein [Syntrophales bacterium]
MIQRTLSRKLSSLAAQFPVVTVTGPRQSGKTTLTRMVFTNHQYVSLEEPHEREFALTDPKGFLKRFEGGVGVILDEIQRAPDLLSYLQGIVDTGVESGRFILTGSQQFYLSAKVNQTLAGRTAIVHLLPFSMDELLNRSSRDSWSWNGLPDRSAMPAFDLETMLYRGFYPRIHDQGLAPQDWLAAYYQTYVERDVREVSNIGNLETFQRFVRLCAGRTGQLLNLSSLANDCGVSHTTARQWVSILQAGFIIHLLPPHFINFSKRIVKSAKLYFLDTGLLCYLLRIREPADLTDHAMRGAVFETYVVSELFKAFTHRGEMPPLYFWRDRTGHEVDVLIDTGKKLIPIEIKSGKTVSASFFEGLRYFMKLGPKVARPGVLIHGGDNLYEREDFIVLPWFQAT